MVDLDCPLCGAAVARAVSALGPGRCPGCGARFEGDGEHPVDGVAAAVRALGIRGLPPEPLARALFSLGPGEPGADLVAVTSDRRDGFYRWWLFVREDLGAPSEVLAEVLRRHG